MLEASVILDFLKNQQSHIFESIKLADEKAALLCAINTGAIYVVLSSHFDEKYALTRRPLLLASVLLLGLGAAICLCSVYPLGGIVDRHIEGGPLAIPTKATSLSQSDYKTKLLQQTSEQLIDEMIAFVCSRTVIRAWKFYFIKWAISLSAVGYIVFVSALMFRDLKWQWRMSKATWWPQVQFSCSKGDVLGDG